jgi:hypothetical protein
MKVKTEVRRKKKRKKKEEVINYLFFGAATHVRHDKDLGKLALDIFLQASCL